MRRSERADALVLIHTDLDVVYAKLDTAVSNCRQWVSAGYPASSYPEASVAGGGYSDPVGVLVTDRHVLDVFRADLHEADKRVLIVRDSMRWLAAFTLRNTERALTAGGPGLIDCANPRCDRYMTGLGNDRPRDGRCPRCYMHRRRYGEDWPMHLVGKAQP